MDRRLIWLPYTDWHGLANRWHLVEYKGEKTERTKKSIVCRLKDTSDLPSEICNTPSRYAISLVCKNCQRFADMRELADD